MLMKYRFDITGMLEENGNWIIFDDFHQLCGITEECVCGGGGVFPHIF